MTGVQTCALQIWRNPKSYCNPENVRSVPLKVHLCAFLMLNQCQGATSVYILTLIPLPAAVSVIIYGSRLAFNAVQSLLIAPNRGQRDNSSLSRLLQGRTMLLKMQGLL